MTRAYDPNFDPIPDPDPAGVTNDQIGELAEAIEQGETIWDQIAREATAMVACPECGGGAHTSAGSLGTHQCFACNGRRVVEHPLADEMSTLELPDLAGARKQLVAARTAWRVRQQGLRDGKSGTDLPAGADPAAVAAALAVAQAAKVTGKEKTRELMAAAPPVRRRQLAPVAVAADGPTDEDLDDLERFDLGGKE